MGADTRIASGHSYVRHTHNMDHIVPINAEVVMARTGNSARTLHLAQQLQRDQHWQFLRYNRILTVSQLASRVQNIMYHDDLSQQQQQESPLVEIIVAGIDRHTHKCHIYTISPSGAIIHHHHHQQPQHQRFGFATCGSGSTYITGYLQQEQMDQRTTTTGLTETDAIGICRRAMEMALQHDASSGGDICLTTISTSSSSSLSALSAATATQKLTQDTDSNGETTTSNRSTNTRPRIQQRHYTIHRPMRH
jgi:20S proteasome alpha/beta subunit